MEKVFHDKASALIRHCINTFGADEVEKWGVELCALHDGALEFLETPEEYARRFRLTYQMIKTWLPKMVVGGPEAHIAKDNTFIEAVAIVSTPTCGPCLGGYMGILAKGERAVATTNRNFVGRMGDVESEVYLASPAVAAASAILGRIADPKEVM